MRMDDDKVGRHRNLEATIELVAELVLQLLSAVADEALAVALRILGVAWLELVEGAVATEQIHLLVVPNERLAVDGLAGDHRLHHERRWDARHLFGACSRAGPDVAENNRAD